MNIPNLSFKHREEDPYFFENLSFQIEPGFIHALHGKNGTGKTVLLKLLAAKSGDVALVNQRFDQMLADQFTFEENLMFAGMTKFPSLFSRLRPSKDYSELLGKFHIDFTLPVKNLSGGQRQILALLMVLQKNVKTLLLDEPTATLDQENARMVFDFLLTLANQNRTVLVVCHDQELIKEYTNGKELHLVREPSGVRRLLLNPLF